MAVVFKAILFKLHVSLGEVSDSKVAVACVERKLLQILSSESLWPKVLRGPHRHHNSSCVREQARRTHMR